MTASLNHVVLLGTIGQYGVSMRYAPSGAGCASFTLTVPELGSDGKVHTLYVPCEVWGKHAEAASTLADGELVLFEGKLAKRKKGEQWELVVSGFAVTAVRPTVASLDSRNN